MLLLLCTALCLCFLFHRADQLPGGVRHVFASPATDITHPTATLATPIKGNTHCVPVPSQRWWDAASAPVTAATAPSLAATFASTIPSAIPAASMVAINVDVGPVLCAALH